MGFFLRIVFCYLVILNGINVNYVTCTYSLFKNSTNFPGRYTILRAFGTYLYVVGVPAALDVEVGVGGDGEYAGPAVDDEVVLGAGVDVEAQKPILTRHQ